MKLKNISAMLCAAVLCFAMSACGSDNNTAEETVSDTAAVSDSTTVSEGSASETGEQSETEFDIDAANEEHRENPAKNMIKFDLPEGFKSKGESFNELAYGDGVANIILKANYNEEGFPPVAEFEAAARSINTFTYLDFEMEYGDPIDFTLNGYDAVESTYVVRDPENKENAAKYRTIYVETETCAYSLTLGSMEYDFDKYNDTFNKVIESIEFIKE